MPDICKMIIFFSVLAVMAACSPVVEGTGDEIAGTETSTETEADTETSAGTEAGTETETSTGTETSTTETTNDTEVVETDTGTSTETETGETCETTFEPGEGDGDCFIMVACPDRAVHTVNCDKDGCTCFEDDVEVGGCPDSSSFCGAHDLSALETCCGWVP
jgi:hypothetical protein